MAAAVLAVPFASPGGPLSLVPVAFQQPPPLTISGNIEGLRAGVPDHLTLTLGNPGDETVLVSSLSTRVTAASGACSPQALSVAPWSGRLLVPAHGTATTSVGISLANSSDCGTATWQLAYTSR